MKSSNREWTTLYWDAMMKENYDEAFSIKEKHFPQTFFKYRRLSELTLDNLVKNYIWCAEISSLNDPFECSLQFDNDECLRIFFADEKFHRGFKNQFGQELSNKEVKEIISSKSPYHTYANVCAKRGIILNIKPEDQLRTVQERWAQIIEETNHNIKICSFSEVSDSLLLWSHYAEDHKGICIEYDLVNDDKIRPFLQPIVYSEKVYKIGLMEDLTMLRKIGSTLIKSKDWEYEAEWRYTALKYDKEFPNKVTVADPKAVYLGARFNLNEELLKHQLLEILQDRSIPIYQMTKHPEEYKLVKAL